MICPWCGQDKAGKCGEGYCDEERRYGWVRWYCDWHSGCGMMWEYAEDGSGFLRQLRTTIDGECSMQLNGEMVVHGEIE